MKLMSHEIERGWRLAADTFDPLERVLRVQCAIGLGFFSPTNIDHMTVIASITRVLESSKRYSSSLPTKDADAALDRPERMQVTINRFVQACRDGKQEWPYESPIGVLPAFPLHLSSQESGIGWEIAASVSDPVERAIRVRCGMRRSHASAPGIATVMNRMDLIFKAASIKHNKSMSGMVERIEDFVKACHAGIKRWPYDSPIGIMPDWSNDVSIEIVMKS